MAPRLTKVPEGPPRSPGDLKEVEDSEPLPPVDVFVALDFEAFVAFEGGFAEKIFFLTMSSERTTSSGLRFP